MRQRYASLYERLIANSYKPDDQNENGCWLWTGKLDGKRGGMYGRINVRVNGKHCSLSTHRVMEGILRLHDEQRDSEPHEFDPLVLFVELDPDLETVDHLCQSTMCINPDHYQVVDRTRNSVLMQERRKDATRRNPNG